MNVLSNDDAYAAGVRGATQAIADGFPRWMHTDIRPLGQCIDPGTGLPLVGISGPPEFADYNAALIRGYNETIAAGIVAGEVTVDFRPLVMSRPEVLQALEERRLGTLSLDHPRIEGPDGAFVLELRLPKRNVKRPLTWIAYRRGDEHWPKFSLYDGPEHVALGRNGKVLIFKRGCVVTTIDVETTQVLITYPL